MCFSRSSLISPRGAATQLSKSSLLHWIIEIRDSRFSWPRLANSQRGAPKQRVRLGHSLDRKTKCWGGDSERSDSLRTGGSALRTRNPRHLLHEFFSLSCKTRNPCLFDFLFQDRDIGDCPRCKFNECNVAEDPQKSLS